MSGRKQFDEERALESAMRVFWAKGYEAASMADLEAATGLNKSSIYNAWSSKEGLFTRCLERFSAQYGANMVHMLDEPDFATAIESFFDALLARFEDGETPKGCLATAAAIEVGGGEAACSRHVASGLEAMRTAFAARAERAVRDGQLPPGTDCNALGAMLLAQTRGMAVLNRGAGDAALARDALRGLLAVVGASPKPSH